MSDSARLIEITTEQLVVMRENTTALRDLRRQLALVSPIDSIRQMDDSAALQTIAQELGYRGYKRLASQVLECLKK